MFRGLVVPGPSSRPWCTAIANPLRPAAFHTSSRWQESQRTRLSRMQRKQHIERTEARKREHERGGAHVVLGIRAGEEAKWQNCNLAKVLVTPEKLEHQAPTLIQRHGSEFPLPPYLSYGVDGAGDAEGRARNVDFFFKDVPDASTQHMVEWSEDHGLAGTTSDPLIKKYSQLETRKSVQFARVIDLRNANQRGIAFENRRRIVQAFSEPGSPNDTGRPEVQVAILTMRIRNLWDHMTTPKRGKRDVDARRSLRQLVHQRAKVLKYIKKQDADRYDNILQRVGVEREAVEGQLVV